MGPAPDEPDIRRRSQRLVAQLLTGATGRQTGRGSPAPHHRYIRRSTREFREGRREESVARARGDNPLRRGFRQDGATRKWGPAAANAPVPKYRRDPGDRDPTARLQRSYVSHCRLIRRTRGRNEDRGDAVLLTKFSPARRTVFRKRGPALRGEPVPRMCDGSRVACDPTGRMQRASSPLCEC